MTPRVRLAAALAAATMLAACGSDAPAPPTAGTVPAAPAAIATASSDALRTRAGEAMAARRFFAPAGDNAAELLLELRERGRSEGGDAAALAELQPYLVIAAEQAVERRDAAEAQRLVDLLARIDADAPAIPRLRTAVQEARTAVVVAVRAAEAGSSTPDVAQGLAEPARATPPAPAGARAAATAAATPPAAVAPAQAPAAQEAQDAQAAVRPVATGEPLSPSAGGAAPADAAPMRVAPALRLVQDAQPRYPARALDRRLDGRVELMFTVRPDGSIADLRIVDARPAGVFDQAALQAARRWRFAPIPVATTTTRALRFSPPQG